MFIACLLGVFAAEPTIVVTRENVEEWVQGPGKQLGKKLAEEKVRTVAAMLSNAKQQRVNPDVMKQLFAELTSAKAAVKNPQVAWPKIMADRLQVGQIGVLRRIMAMSEEQIASEEYEVLQLVDGSNMIVEMEYAKKGEFNTLWMEVATSGKVDGSTYRTGNQPFEVVGTKQYATANGTSNTVFHLRLFDVSTVKRSVEQR